MSTEVGTGVGVGSRVGVGLGVRVGVGVWVGVAVGVGDRVEVGVAVWVGMREGVGVGTVGVSVGGAVGVLDGSSVAVTAATCRAAGSCWPPATRTVAASRKKNPTSTNAMRRPVRCRPGVPPLSVMPWFSCLPPDKCSPPMVRGPTTAHYSMKQVCGEMVLDGLQSYVERRDTCPGPPGVV